MVLKLLCMKRQTIFFLIFMIMNQFFLDFSTRSCLIAKSSDSGLNTLYYVSYYILIVSSRIENIFNVHCRHMSMVFIESITFSMAKYWPFLNGDLTYVFIPRHLIWISIRKKITYVCCFIRIYITIFLNKFSTHSN